MAVFTLAVKAASSVYSPTPRWVVLSVWVAQAERPSAAAAITAPRVLDTRIRIRIPTSCHSRETGEIAAIFVPASAPVQEFPSRHAVRCAVPPRDGAGFFAVRGFASEEDRVIERRSQFLAGAFAVHQHVAASAARAGILHSVLHVSGRELRAGAFAEHGFDGGECGVHELACR